MKSKTKSASKEAVYPGFPLILGEALTGQRPIDDLVEHPEFQKQAKRICYLIARDVEKAEELFQDSCLKMLGHEREGRGFSFFGWYSTSTRNLFRSKLRKKGLTIDSTPVEEHPIVANGVDPENERRLNEALEFISTLPVVRQLAFEYWLEDYSSRKIAGILNGMGIKCSHVTVANWNNQTLKDIRNGKATPVKKAAGF